MHGKAHHDRHRQWTVGLLVFWLTQVAMWTVLLIGAFVIPSLRSLFEKVYWVSILSLYANLTTVASIVAGLWAALTAGRAHEDAERTREVVQLDLEEFGADLDQLADAHGIEARQLARRLHRKYGGAT